MAEALVSPTPATVRLGVEPGEPDDGLSVFVEARPRLFGIAYRMLGNVAEAEDIVQDVWVRWQSTNQKEVETPAAFLARTTTRLCINFLQSAQSRREICIGTWLPEPVAPSSDPTIGAERDEALKLAVLIVLEKLTPTERAAYVLREAFDYSYGQISSVLQIEEPNTRQLVSRARRHIVDSRRAPVSAVEQRRLLEAFLVAAHKGDMAALEGLFANDLVSHSNSAGTLCATPDPGCVHERIVNFIAAVSLHLWNVVALSLVEIDGQAGMLMSREGAPVAFVTTDATVDDADQFMWIKKSGEGSVFSRVDQKSGDKESSEPAAA